MKALVGAFNQEKALVGAFSVIVQLFWLIMYMYSTNLDILQLSTHLQRYLIGDRVGSNHVTSNNPAAAAGI